MFLLIKNFNMATNLDLKTIGIIAGIIIGFLILIFLGVLLIVGIKVLKRFEKKEKEDSTISSTTQQREKQELQTRIQNLEQQVQDNGNNQQKLEELKAEFQKMITELKNSSEAVIETLKKQMEILEATLEHQKGLSKVDVPVFNNMLKAGMDNLKLESGNYPFDIRRNEGSLSTIIIPMYVYQSEHKEPVISVVPCSYPCYEKLPSILSDSRGVKSRTLLAAGDSQTGKSFLSGEIVKCFSSKKIVCVLPLDALDFSSKFENDTRYSDAMLRIIEEFQKRVEQLARENPTQEVIAVIIVDEFEGKDPVSRKNMLMKPEHLKKPIDDFNGKRQNNQLPENLDQCVIAIANNAHLFEQVAATTAETDPIEVLVNRFGGATKFDRIKNHDHAMYVLLTLLGNKQHKMRNEKIERNDGGLKEMYVKYLKEGNERFYSSQALSSRVPTNTTVNVNDIESNEEKDRRTFAMEFSKTIKEKMTKPRANNAQENIRKEN